MLCPPEPHRPERNRRALFDMAEWQAAQGDTLCGAPRSYCWFEPPLSISGLEWMVVVSPEISVSVEPSVFPGWQ